MAAAGKGAPSHLAGELFKMMAGIDMAHVPYRGSGPGVNDLLAGQVQVMFPTTVASIGHIRSGRLNALAVTQGAAGRPGGLAATRLARRLRQAHRRGNRKVGQGDQVRQHQGGVIRAMPAEYSVTPVARNRARSRADEVIE